MEKYAFATATWSMSMRIAPLDGANAAALRLLHAAQRRTGIDFSRQA